MRPGIKGSCRPVPDRDRPPMVGGVAGCCARYFASESGLEASPNVMPPTPDAHADTTAQALHDAMQAHGAGLLLFTLEAHADDGRAYFRFLKRGRYSHRAGYGEAALQSAGFEDVERAAVVPRMEAQRPVNGWLVSSGRPC